MAISYLEGIKKIPFINIMKIITKDRCAKIRDGIKRIL